MMMNDPKRNLSSLIMARVSPPKGDAPPDAPEADSQELNEGQKAASQEALEAVKSDDGEAFGRALQSFFQCTDQEQDEEEESDEPKAE